MEKTQNNYTVYIHILPNTMVYVGITSKTVNERWRTGKGYKKNQHFYRAIQKYGWDNIKHIIVCEGVDSQTAFDTEKFLIFMLDSTNRNKGYNHSFGGESGTLGYKFTEQQRKTASNRQKGKTLSKETKAKISFSESGSKNHNYKGKVLCVETGVVYESSVDAAKANNIFKTNMSAALVGKAKTAGGYHWKRLLNE